MNLSTRLRLALKQIRMAEELIKSGRLTGLARELAESEIAYNRAMAQKLERELITRGRDQ